MPSRPFAVGRAETTPLDREKIADILADHSAAPVSTSLARCVCGWTGTGAARWKQHREHLAAAVLAALPTPGPMLADRETLARNLYRLHAWSGCAGSDWDRVPELVRVEFRDQADALIASGAVQTPGQYVAGLADDETLVERVALHGLFRHEQVAKRESAQDRWDTTLSDDDQDEYRDLARAAIRALAAALTERTDRG